MIKYKIVGLNFGNHVGFMTINDNNEFSIEIFDEVGDIIDIPFYLIEYWKNGQRHFDNDICTKMFQRMIAPPNRDNIQEMLEKIGLKEYNLVEIIKRVGIHRPHNFKLVKIA